MKKSKLPVIILTVLLVICIGGSTFLYSTLTATISELQASEEQLIAEVDALTVQLADKQTIITELNTQKQDLADEAANLENVIDNTQVELDKTEQFLANELSRKDDWSVYIEPDKIIGEWVVLNLVEEENRFDPNEQVAREFWLKSIRFNDEIASFNTGEGYGGGSSWVDDHIVLDDAAMGFMIQEIDGLEYLFLEWKSGDYLRNNSVAYYVFKKAD